MNAKRGNQGQPAATDNDKLSQSQPQDSARGPGTGHLAADQDMDDDTGLSNRVNRQSADIEHGKQQSEQSNVGRRDDGTPD